MERTRAIGSKVAKMMTAQWSVLAIAIMMIAAGFDAPSQGAAKEENQTRKSVEQVCDEQG